MGTPTPYANGSISSEAGTEDFNGPGGDPLKVVVVGGDGLKTTKVTRAKVSADEATVYAKRFVTNHGGRKFQLQFPDLPKSKLDAYVSIIEGADQHFIVTVADFDNDFSVKAFQDDSEGKWLTHDAGHPEAGGRTNPVSVHNVVMRFISSGDAS